VNLILTESFPWDEVDKTDNLFSEREEGICVMKDHRERNVTKGLCIVEYISGSHKITKSRDTRNTLGVQLKCAGVF
jgi:hypothetical protein